MATNNANTPARHIDDRLPGHPLQWEGEQGAMEADEPLGEPLQQIADRFKIEADGDSDAELRAGGEKRLIAFDYFKRGWLASDSNTASAARQGGITSLEGLTRYGFCDIDSDNFIERPDGRYVEFADVEHLFASQVEAAAPLTGWKMVPVSLTEEMHVAAVRSIIRATGNDDCPPAVWAAMLAAAPADPVQAPQTDELREFLLNRIQSYDHAGKRLEKLILGHNDVWMLRNLLSVEAAQAPQQSELTAERLREEDIDIVWRTMPGGPAAWLKGFGYLNFARAIEDEVHLAFSRAQAAPATPVQTAEHEQLVRAGWFTYEGIEWVATSSDDPRATILYRKANVAAPVQAEQAQAEPTDDDKYAVIVDRRDLFDFLRAAWRAGQDFFGPMTERERWERATNYATAEIKGWSTMRALPAQAEQAAAVRAAYENAAQIAQTPIAGEQDDITMAAKDRIATAIRALAAPSTTPSNDTSAQGDTGGDK